jgi:hypothetical protein
MKFHVNAHNDRPYKRKKILFCEVRKGCRRPKRSSPQLYAQTSIIQSPEVGIRIPAPQEEQRPLARVVGSGAADRLLVDDLVCDACVHSQSVLDRRRC